ncbi:EF-hand domain-containing protein [Streptomyces diastatochromogenes]|nr:EF-hand domain-containing protein [Streptomyces diastatochromogenes]
MDANGDGVMTYEEYIAWVDADKFDNICQYALGALFDLADADRDGSLDRAQFTTLRQALGNRADNADAAFDALDGDGDGRVGRAEYLASIRAYVTGEESPWGRPVLTGAARHPLDRVPCRAGRGQQTRSR